MLTRREPSRTLAVRRHPSTVAPRAHPASTATGASALKHGVVVQDETVRSDSVICWASSRAILAEAPPAGVSSPANLRTKIP